MQWIRISKSKSTRASRSWIQIYESTVSRVFSLTKYLDYIHNETENKLLKDFLEAIIAWENSLTTLGNQLAKYMRTTPPVKIKKTFFASIKKIFKISFGEYLHRHISSDISMSGNTGVPTCPSGHGRTSFQSFYFIFYLFKKKTL